jgi:hypothetical protein
MKKQNKFNIYIGLLKNDMKTALNREVVLNEVVQQLKNIGVIGFEIENIKGYWNGEPEPALKISFINTFEVKTKDILKVLENLKISLSQESILLEKKIILYNFV